MRVPTVVLNSHVLADPLLAAGRGGLVVPPGATLPAAEKANMTTLGIGYCDYLGTSPK